MHFVCHGWRVQENAVRSAHAAAGLSDAVVQVVELRRQLRLLSDLFDASYAGKRTPLVGGYRPTPRIDVLSEGWGNTRKGRDNRHAGTPSVGRCDRHGRGSWISS